MQMLFKMQVEFSDFREVSFHTNFGCIVPL